MRTRASHSVTSMLLLGCACAAAIVPSATGSPDVEKWRLAFAGEPQGRRGLDVYVALVPGGSPRRVVGVAGRDDFSPAWSPNGKLIAYRQNPARSDESDIMVVSAQGGRPRNLTRSPGTADWSPAWSPDGKLIAFFSNRAGGNHIWTMKPDGSQPRQLTRSGFLNEYPSWSPDGKRIVFQTARNGEFDIYVMGRNGAFPAEPLAPSRSRSMGLLVPGRAVHRVHVGARRQRRCLSDPPRRKRRQERHQNSGPSRVASRLEPDR